MSLEHVLLGMLNEPRSGYDLKQEFQEGTRYFWFAELSQIYPTLQRMEKRKWVRSKKEPSTKGPPRRVYRRTKAGTREFFEWIREGPTFGKERIAYIAQLIYLGQIADLDETSSFLEALLERFEGVLELLMSAEAYHAEAADQPDGLDDLAFHDRLAVRLGIRSLEGRVRACDEALSLVAERKAHEKDLGKRGRRS